MSPDRRRHVRSYCCQRQIDFVHVKRLVPNPEVCLPEQERLYGICLAWKAGTCRTPGNRAQGIRLDGSAHAISQIQVSESSVHPSQLTHHGRLVVQAFIASAGQSAWSTITRAESLSRVSHATLFPIRFESAKRPACSSCPVNNANRSRFGLSESRNSSLRCRIGGFRDFE